MIDPIKQDYIDYRIQSARETLKAAKLLAENSIWNSAINRLYYCCFYAISALVYAYDLKAKSHSGTKHQFTLNFVKTGLVENNLSKVYFRLFDWRHKGDYGDFIDFDKEKTLPLIEPVEKLIQTVQDLIDKKQKSAS